MELPKFKPFPKTRKFKLEWREDQHGNRGWILAGMDNFDAGQGLTIAHDILEHFEHESECGKSEYEAFGCMVWGRWAGDYWGSFVSPPPQSVADMLADSLASFCRDLGPGSPAPSWALNYEFDEEDKDRFDQLHTSLVSALPGEMADNGDYTVDEYRAMADNIVGWVKAGFIRAENTWGKIVSPFYLTNLFYTIERDMDEDFQHGEESEILMVTIDYHNVSHTIRRGRLYEDSYGRVRIDYRMYEI